MQKKKKTNPALMGQVQMPQQEIEPIMPRIRESLTRVPLAPELPRLRESITATPLPRLRESITATPMSGTKKKKKVVYGPIE